MESKVTALIDELNRVICGDKSSPFVRFEATTRRKYILVDGIAINTQRTGRYVIDRLTGDVFNVVVYGRPNKFIGTLDDFLAHMTKQAA